MEVGSVEKLVFNRVSRAISAGIVLSPRGVLATRVAQKGKLLICLRLFQLTDSCTRHISRDCPGTAVEGA